MEERFIAAIHEKNKIRVTFFSKKDEMDVTRICAPMDIGLHSRFPDKGDYYHVWDYDSPSRPHPIALKEDQIIDIEFLADIFEPNEFVTWEPSWTISRDWGSYS